MRRWRTTVHEKEYNRKGTSNCQRPNFHWCCEPERKTGLGCFQAPLAVATSKPSLVSQHVEKNLESRASSLEVPILEEVEMVALRRQARHGRVVRRLS